MKVLVTGANGFLAANIIRELNRREVPVRGMVRKTADLRSLAGTDCEIHYGELLDKADVLKAVGGCNIIIHAAASTTQYSEDLSVYFPVNVRGTENVVNAATISGVDRLIYVSTANTCRNGTLDNPGNESLEAGFPFTGSGYAMSKIIAQKAVLEHARLHKLDAVVVNPTFMIGPYDARPSSGRILLMGYRKRIMGVPPGGKNFVHVRDVATGVCNAITMGRNGECYLLANENLSFLEFFRKVESVTGFRQYKFIVPGGVMSLMGSAGSFFNRLGLKGGLTLSNARLLNLDNYYSPAKALRELGLPQTPVEQAIRDALEWFGQNGYLSHKRQKNVL